MKLSKSPDIKICQHRRSQKCVFKKMKLSKSPDIKIFLSKMCVQKNESPDQNFKNVCSKK